MARKVYRPKTGKSVPEIITETIMKELEAGTVPWKRRWNAPETAPRNAMSGKPYRGINRILLGSVPGEWPLWITLKQANSLGGSIIKGSHGMPVVYYKTYDRETEDVDPETGEKETQRRWVMRYYTVFNLSQTRGLPEFPMPEAPLDHDPIAAAEEIVTGYLERGGPQLRREGDRAYYRPMTDTVCIPRSGYFETPAGYYSTLFHEFGHSTGHTSRLDRKLDSAPAPFGSEDYSKEELLAEMTAAFLCGETGIEQETVQQSAAYIASWLKALRNDERLVISAAAQGQKAADYITGTAVPF